MTEDSAWWVIHHAPLILSGMILMLIVVWLVVDLVRHQRWP